MKYVDGFVLAVPSDKKQDYIKHVSDAADVFMEYGALSLVECWGDDVPEGQLTSFPMAVKCQPNETVCFSWVTWPSKSFRDEAMEKLMADPRLQPDVNPMPFDGNRMIFGSFNVVVER
ncbi:DUF1428 domain-containing protein [Thalassotalea sp. HSM 43]|uniref:DUF1428 domain-containing protein n=1 Tax=Thalassotalea sp. HSM 43 TaxID=2552945 RepID=UPI001081EFAB|nr:DUF1428 domain-containing protein [Thalassotalea sp. HSM 43]QBY05997.1 DUF1428 domain-containing protein [Thalassotalea sp. HSM 43]